MSLPWQILNKLYIKLFLLQDQFLSLHGVISVVLTHTHFIGDNSSGRVNDTPSAINIGVITDPTSTQPWT